MEVGKRDSVQELFFKSGAHAILARAEVARRAAAQMAISGSRGFERLQPQAPGGYGGSYVSERPRLAKVHSPRMSGGDISHATGRKLLENRVSQLATQRENAAADFGPGSQPYQSAHVSQASAAGQAVVDKVEAALASLTIGLQSGLYTSSSVVEPAKEALAALLSGGAELSAQQLRSLLAVVTDLADLVDTNIADSAHLGGKVGEVQDACFYLLEACMAVLDQQLETAERGDSTIARRGALKAEARQLAQTRLANLKSGTQQIRDAAVLAARARGPVPVIAPGGRRTRPGSAAPSVRVGPRAPAAPAAVPAAAVPAAAVPAAAPAAPAAVPAAAPAGVAAPAAADPAREYTIFRVTLQAARDKAQALQSLADYNAATGAAHAVELKAKDSLAAAKRAIVKAVPQP